MVTVKILWIGDRDTVEPPIRNPLRQGRPLYKGHLLRHHANILVYYFTSEIGTTSLQGTKLFGGSTVKSLEYCRWHYFMIFPQTEAEAS